MNVVQLACGHFIAEDQLVNRPYCFVCGKPAEDAPATEAKKSTDECQHSYFPSGRRLEMRCTSCGARQPKGEHAPADLLEAVMAAGASHATATDNLTRAQCLARLDAVGYTGPVSYTVTKLREIVAREESSR